MKRDRLDLTDNELYELCRCLAERLNSRDAYWNKKNSRIFNSLFKKVYNNGMERNNYNEILEPIIDFDEDDEHTCGECLHFFMGECDYNSENEITTTVKDADACENFVE